MSEFKGTTGPWEVGRSGAVISKNKESLTINGSTGKDAVKYYGGNLICESVSPENAKLIACAPQMLDALNKVIRLKGLIEYSGVISEEHVSESIVIGNMLSNIENVIKKATE
jgi:hypothetical protein